MLLFFLFLLTPPPFFPRFQLYEPKPALRDDEEAERVAQAVLLMDAIRRHDEAVGYIPVDKTSGSEVVDF